ncbi:type II secretion system F family protein [Aestuariimicrobium ganziense]|uniref:type II secretion system F family protein n=1 Tax=Aestuariimicrobium ganziense TaxID=2773677 RepID=UPI001944F8DD|nr:type II secretion system F family protein [Aestuariimicrobium ganziense]
MAGVAALAAGLTCWCVWPVRAGVTRLRAGPRNPRLPALLQGAGDLPPRVRLVAAVAGAVAALMMLPGWYGWVGGLLAAAVVGVGSGHLQTGRQRRRQEALAREMPVALDLLVAMVCAGAPLRGAATQVAAVSPPTTAEVLGLVVSHTQVGLSDERAWRQLVEGPQWSGRWAPVARDLARSVSTGAGVAQVLSTHAREARRRRQEALERTARTVGIRSVLPLMVCFLPAFVLVGVVPIVAGTILRALG